MRLPDESESMPQINIVPMIDVVFAILTFLIVSSLELTKSGGMPVNLPSASTAQVQKEPTKITVTIDSKGKLMLEKKVIELNSLENGVSELLKKDGTAVVVLNADKSIEHGRVVEVMDKVRRIKGAKLAIATKRQ